VANGPWVVIGEAPARDVAGNMKWKRVRETLRVWTIIARRPQVILQTRQDVFCGFENWAVLQQMARGDVRLGQT